MTPENYILRCFDLAKNGQGYTAPNPLVGAVLVHGDKIIGEGWHQQYGQPHAEVNAINSALQKELIPQSELYVNLEPCAHLGKTPPCADLIIHAGIKKVYISNLDPNPLVAGKGIEKLRNAGIEVVTDILKQQGAELNKKFFSFHHSKKTYTFLKWAETADGYIAPQVEDPDFQQKKQLSNALSKRMVHQWRAEHMAILIGTNTAFYDNPMLNVRLAQGPNPLRVVWDPQMRLPHWLHIFDGKQRTLLLVDEYFSSDAHHKIPNVEYAYINFSSNPAHHTLKVLYEMGIQSLMVEGGAQVLQTFINEKCWDECAIIRNNKWFGDGIKSPRINKTSTLAEPLGDNTIFHFSNH
jgi:diaminohydroxyphosphoribosylaminopyrimidine deaminase/5-amino-6-(5-phosphoribosylamino)uracil reductase